MREAWKAAGAVSWGATDCAALGLSAAAQAALDRLCPAAATVLVAAFSYYAGAQPGNLSRYCRGADYHSVLKARLERLSEGLRLRHPGHDFLPLVDASPIPEQRAAELAGLGLRGQNGLLIVPGFGSFVFLGTIVTDLPRRALSLPPQQGGAVSLGCADCGRCVRACPTGALSGGGFDAARCLSQISQKKGELSAQERAWISKSPLIWGCDLCQRVCPHNQQLPQTEIPEFRENLLCSLHKEDLEGLGKRAFLERYRGRAFTWRGPAPLRRNLALQEGEG